jgi:hypothetical protein
MPSSPREPYKISPMRAVVLLLFRPRAFVRESVRHDRSLRFDRHRRPQRAETTRRIRVALGWGATLVVLSAAAGALAGLLLSYAFGPPRPMFIAGLQVAAGAILLWATLNYLGWEIQSYKGQNLGEKVNRWIFRGNYCLGTAVLVTSLTWPL